MSAVRKKPGLLGDTTARDYSFKLKLFNAHARPELRHAIESLRLVSGMRVLDAGCGTGETVQWLQSAVSPTGLAIGMDLAIAHAKAARAALSADVGIVQADVLAPPLRDSAFDLVWCANTINHLRDPRDGVRRLAALVYPGGRIALMQSSFQPEMFFAWDARLEKCVHEAVRTYYREHYGVSEYVLTAIRSLVGLLRAAGLQDIRPKTYVIERTSPLGEADSAYLLEAIFRRTFGERLRPYLSREDFAELERICDPNHADYALRRDDFHYIQQFTVVVGTVPSDRS